MLNIDGLFFDAQDYEIKETEKPLGKGCYGKVYKITKISDNKTYAVKILDISKGFEGQDQKNFFSESYILFQLHHPSIVKFHGINFQAFSDPELTDNRLRPSIITEYLTNGSIQDLFDKLYKNKEFPQWTATKKIISILGISNAMSYLHKNGILHCDLKPENILFDDNFYPYISDFGLSKCFKDSLTSSKEFYVSKAGGTPLYMAPEVLNFTGKVTYAVDVFSFAIITHQIISGKMPYDLNGKNYAWFFNHIMSGNRPNLEDNSFTEEMKDLLKQCWSPDPEERLTFNAIYTKLRYNYKDYIKGEINEEEMSDYISKYCHEAELSENIKDKQKIKKLIIEKNDITEEINQMAMKYSKFEKEHEIKSKTNSCFHSALIGLLGRQQVRNPRKAIRNLMKASDEGNSDASFILGLLYESNDYFQENCETKNYQKALEYFQKSGEQGNSRGYQRIGYFYIAGLGVEKSKEKAQEYFEKAVELNDSTAMNSLGSMYKDGLIDNKKNFEEAKRYYEMAEKLGDLTAANNLGKLYYDGFLGKKDYATAKMYFEKAKETEPIAWYNLGLIYQFGDVESTNSEEKKGVKQDLNIAIQYFLKAAQLNCSYAENTLGELYESGTGVPQDLDEAEKYYLSASNHGFFKAKENLNSLRLSKSKKVKSKK